MKFTFVMLVVSALGLGLLELGQRTSIHILSQVGLAAVLIAAVAANVDAVLRSKSAVSVTPS